MFNDALLKRKTFKERKSIRSTDRELPRFYSSNSKERAFTPWDASVEKSDVKSTWQSNPRINEIFQSVDAIKRGKPEPIVNT